jgi:uncharacterized RDD family membrane protein YckC
MKCPKCHYVGFAGGRRCRHCGYDFSLSFEAGLAHDETGAGDRSPRSRSEPPGLTPSRVVHAVVPETQPYDPDEFRPQSPAVSYDLPLFQDLSASGDDRPLIPATAVPRAPLAVRRATPAVPRARPRFERPPPPEPTLDLEVPLDPEPTEPRPAPRTGPPLVSQPLPSGSLPVAPGARRLAAAAIDASVLLGINLAVLYFTLQICGLMPQEVMRLPFVPLLGFFLILDGGYLVAFTAAGGQTIGKMAFGLKVVGERDGPLTLNAAVLRAAASLVSTLPAGLGFVPGLVCRDRRTLHDRVAATRVVRIPEH